MDSLHVSIKKIIILATHNNRLQCFFTKIMSDKSYNNKKFKNCAIIRCYGNKNIVNFELIYEGELANDEISKLTKPIDDEYWNTSSFNKIFSINSCSTSAPINNTEIFLVRHGKGIHNGANFYEKIKELSSGKFKDAELVALGWIQAINSAKYLKNYLKTLSKYDSSLYLYGASHLKRTHQTIGIFKYILDNDLPEHESFNKIYIIPCSHELMYSSDGNCDNPKINVISNLIARENVPKCTGNSEQCDFIMIKSKKYNIDWSKYIAFNKINNCNETTMINQIISLFM